MSRGPGYRQPTKERLEPTRKSDVAIAQPSRDEAAAAATAVVAPQRSEEEGVEEMFNLADPDDIESRLEHLSDAEMDALLQQAYKINHALKAELARQGGESGQCVRIGSSPVLPPIPQGKPTADVNSDSERLRCRTISKSAH